MRPETILFDWDNTLVDGWAAIQHGLNVTFREFGMPEWDRETVLARVRGSLARYAVPREVRVVGALPRGATGKVLHRDLREGLRRGGAR